MNFKFNKIWIIILAIILSCKSGVESESIIRVHPDKSEVKPSYLKFYENIFSQLKKKNILLVTNPSGIGINPEKLMQKFKENETTIKYLLGLEHGFLGLEEDFNATPVTIDTMFNVPIYHIYKLKPLEVANMVNDVDAIIFDVQDMGMRCYTYLTVLKRIMEQIQNNHIQLIILDHANPGLELGTLGDEVVSGFENFAGEFPLLFFTGLTIGESAVYYNSEYLSSRVNLQVVPVENYNRKMRFEKTGIPWNTPSPNLPNIDTARNYMALVFLEGINVSVGRGTQAPFTYFGAPWMTESEELAEILNRESQNKYYFQPVFFKPVISKYKDKICRGLRMTLVNIDYDPIRLGYNLTKAIKEKYRANFSWAGSGNKYMIDNLWGSEGFRKAIDAGLSYEEFRLTYQEKEETYKSRVKKYYMY